MDFKVEFNMDNAEFDEDLEMTVSRKLKQVAMQVIKGKTFGPVMDINGNKIGTWEIKTD